MSIKKRLNVIGLAAAMMAACLPAGGRAQTRDSTQETRIKYTLAQRLPLAQRTSQLMGLTVLDRDDRKLGRVDDLVVDLHNGQTICAVVSLANIYGRDLHILIPSGSFFAADQNNTVLTVEKESLNDAPRITGPVPDASALAKPLADACAYFNVPPAGELNAGEFVKWSQLAGMAEFNPAGRPLGKVMDLWADLPSSHIFYIVASYDGSEKRFYALPPAALAVNLEKRRATLNAEKTDIDQASEWTSFFWTDILNPAWAAGTYHRYGQTLDLTGSCVVVAAPGREYVRTRIDESPAAPSPGAATAQSDSDITKSIMTAFIRDDVANAWAHKGIKINTVNGRVTLSGTVKNEKQKDHFGELAEGVVGAGNVDNELETRK